MMNSYKVYDFFKEDLKRTFSPTPVLLEFSTPNIRAKFPYIIIFLVNISRQRYISPKFLDSETTDHSVKNKFCVGDLMMTVNIQYVAEAGNTKALYDFEDRFKNYIFKQFSAGETEARCLTLNYGQKKYEKALVYLNDTLLDQRSGTNIQSGYVRIIFDLLLEMPEIITNEDPIIKRIEIVDSEISEHARTVSNQ